MDFRGIVPKEHRAYGIIGCGAATGDGAFAEDLFLKEQAKPLGDAAMGSAEKIASTTAAFAEVVVRKEVGGPVPEGSGAFSPDLAEHLLLGLGGHVAEARVRNIEEGSLGLDGYPRCIEGAGPKGPSPCHLGMQLRCFPRPRAKGGPEPPLP